MSSLVRFLSLFHSATMCVSPFWGTKNQNKTHSFFVCLINRMKDNKTFIWIKFLCVGARWRYRRRWLSAWNMLFYSVQSSCHFDLMFSLAFRKRRRNRRIESVLIFDTTRAQHVFGWVRSALCQPLLSTQNIH